MLRSYTTWLTGFRSEFDGYTGRHNFVVRKFHYINLEDVDQLEVCTTAGVLLEKSDGGDIVCENEGSDDGDNGSSVDDSSRSKEDEGLGNDRKKEEIEEGSKFG
jgi:hypothetical protein